MNNHKCGGNLQACEKVELRKKKLKYNQTDLLEKSVSAFSSVSCMSVLQKLQNLTA